MALVCSGGAMNTDMSAFMGAYMKYIMVDYTDYARIMPFSGHYSGVVSVQQVIYFMSVSLA